MAHPLFGRIWKWFAHPLVGAIGTATGVIGLVLAVVLYAKALPSRKVIVMEQGTRSIVFNKDAPSNLRVLFEGEPITNQSVFATQLTLWNAGNQSIRPEHVLTPITIGVTSSSRIVEARVLRSSRAVCEVQPVVEPDRSSVRIDWRILEPDDGAIVQLTVAGDIEGTLRPAGILEAGGDVRAVRVQRQAAKDNSELWPNRPSVIQWVQNGLVLMFFLAVGSRMLYTGTRGSRKATATSGRLEAAMLILFGGVFIVAAVIAAFAMIDATWLRDHVPAGLGGG